MTGTATPAATDVRITRPGRDLTQRPITLRPDQVAGVLAAGDTVVIGHGSGWPRTLVEAMVAEARVPFRIVHNRIDDALPYFTDAARRRVTHLGLMVATQTREHVATGVAAFVPNSYGMTPMLLRGGEIDCDVTVVHVSPPDRDGWCSFGTCVAYLPAAVQRARMVIAQVNPSMPRTSATFVHESAFDYVVGVDAPLPGTLPPAGDEITAAIAGHVAGLVRDGDVLQVGIGKLGDAVLAALAGKCDLRMWTETFNDTAIDLLRNGTLVGGSVGEAPITATFVTGSQRLYDALGERPDIRMLPVDQVNHPAALAAQPNLTAINSALEVDLSGQVNAESIGSLTHSGSGGHLDFAVGAAASPGGRYICAFPSTARGGASRIVAGLREGTAVTVPRSLAGIVVTEYGVATLRGQSLPARAEALIAVAHPDHRPALQNSLRTGARP